MADYTMIFMYYCYYPHYSLVICYIAMEHGPFTDDLPDKMAIFPWLCLPEASGNMMGI